MSLQDTPLFKVHVSAEAYAMFLNHVRFLAKASVNAAKRLDASFRNNIKRVVVSPLQFPYADELDAPKTPPKTYRKILFEQRYKIMYRIDGEMIKVIAVLDARMGNENLFDDLTEH